MGLVKGYLLAYNVGLVISWLWILIGTVEGTWKGLDSGKIYQRLSLWLQVSQSAAILEVKRSVNRILTTVRQ